MRIQAAVDTHNEEADILIMARTGARVLDGLEEAIARTQIFNEIGADINFLEALRSVEEMQQYCSQVNGYKIAVYPLILLNVSIQAMQQ